MLLTLNLGDIGSFSASPRTSMAWLMPLITWSEAVHSSSRDFFKFLILLSPLPWAKCSTFLLGRNPFTINVLETGISLNERDLTPGMHWVGCWPKCLKWYRENIMDCLGDEARSPMHSFIFLPDMEDSCNCISAYWRVSAGLPAYRCQPFSISEVRQCC